MDFALFMTLKSNLGSQSKFVIISFINATHSISLKFSLFSYIQVHNILSLFVFPKSLLTSRWNACKWWDWAQDLGSGGEYDIPRRR